MGTIAYFSRIPYGVGIGNGEGDVINITLVENFDAKIIEIDSLIGTMIEIEEIEPTLEADSLEAILTETESFIAEINEIENLEGVMND